MAAFDSLPLPGEIFEDYAVLDVDELSRLCAVDRRYIVELVEEGVLTVITVENTGWRFDGAALQRARMALRLHQDLEINMPGVALALELMEQIQALRRELKVGR